MSAGDNIEPYQIAELFTLLGNQVNQSWLQAVLKPENPYDRMAASLYIRGSEKLTAISKVRFLADMIRKDQHLKVVAYAWSILHAYFPDNPKIGFLGRGFRLNFDRFDQ